MEIIFEFEESVYVNTSSPSEQHLRLSVLANVTDLPVGITNPNGW